MSMPTFPQKLLRAALWLLMYGVVTTVAFGGLIVLAWVPFPLNLLAHRAYFERKPRLASSPSGKPSAV
jgi:hypothetical protein